VTRGKLRIYLGAAPGVGKTFAMLNEGWRRHARGTDVVVGYLETHGRANTAAQVRDLPVVPRRQVEYRGQVLDEMDLDAVLARHPAVALVDELAHTDIPGGRHEKRWQDIEELLDAGIDVISTVNIQHLVSLNDVVERITGVAQRETVPDAVVRAADQIELVDMHPEALRRRMAHGNIYPSSQVDAALAHYFRVGNLGALRELALLWVTDRVDDELAAYRKRYGIEAPWETKERIVVAITGAPGSDHLLQRGARMAARGNAELVGVHVRSADGYSHDPAASLDAQRRLVGELGGRYAEVTGADVGTALINFARAENATQLVLGATGRSKLGELIHGSIINRVIRDAVPTDVHVISPTQPPSGLPAPPRRHRPMTVPPRRRQLGWLLGTAGIAALAAGLSVFRSSLGLPAALLCLLLAVASVAAIGGALPAVAAAITATLLGDYFFTVPYHSFRIARAGDIVSVAVFFAVAALLSGLIDRLARRALQVSRARAEAEALARLAGRSVVSGAEALPNLVAELRRTFDLDGVAILAPAERGWRTIAAAGEQVATRPEDAPFCAELDAGTMLVLAGEALKADDTPLLAAFVAQLRLAQERMRLEEDAAAAGELAEANSLRGAILAAVSHDLRTPLASIKAAASSLLSEEVEWDPEQARGFAKTIDAQSDRLTHLIANLLDMSRIQAGSVKATIGPVAVEDLLYSVVGTLGASGALVTIDIAERLPPVAADRGLLERALANVIDNAVAWSPPATPVRVEAAVVGDRVDIRVIDQGPGVPRDQRDQIFLPFQRLGDRAGGSPNGVGLGLAVARGFTDAIDSELTVEDTPGGGATFMFSLARI
jgi:two-component system, OmpR family, sensor histidine kinase KdpD